MGRSAPGLKTIGDATEIRARILAAFEKAEVTEDDRAARASVADLRRRRRRPDRRRDGRRHRRTCPQGRSSATSATSIPLRHGSCWSRPATGSCPHSRKACRQSAQASARKAWASKCWLGAAVTHCDDDGVTLADGRHIASACVLWAAGVMASRAAKWLGAPADRAGRVMVDERLSVPGHDEYLRHRRYRRGEGRRMAAGARRRAGRQADGPLCRAG